MGQVTSNDSNQFGTGTDELHIHIHIYIYIYIYIGHDSPGTSIQCKSAELQYHNFHCGRMRKKVRMPGNWNLTYSTTGSKIKPNIAEHLKQANSQNWKLKATALCNLGIWHCGPIHDTNTAYIQCCSSLESAVRLSPSVSQNYT